MIDSVFKDDEVSKTTLVNRFEDVKKVVLKQKLLGNIEFNEDEFLILYHSLDSVVFFSKDSMIQFRIVVKGEKSYLRIDSTNQNLVITGSEYTTRCLGNNYIVSDEYHARIQLGIDSGVQDSFPYLEYNNIRYTCLYYNSLIGSLLSQVENVKEATVIMTYYDKENGTFDTIPFHVKMKDDIFIELKCVNLVRKLNFIDYRE